MSVRVLTGGLYDTLQDGGRYGYQHLGINPGGSMDPLAATVANALVGNEAGATILEMHFPAASLYVEVPVLIALAGADFSPTVNGISLPMQTAIVMTAGSTLRFTSRRSGARCYLAVHGGWQAQEWLGSTGTNTKVAAGGMYGRPVMKGDRLTPAREQPLLQQTGTHPFHVTRVSDHISGLYTRGKMLCVPGAQWRTLDDPSVTQFCTGRFLITPQSDRMGYRLAGEALVQHTAVDMISTGVTRGTIQLLPSGQLIILLADHQATGGYPVIAHVASVALPAMAQCSPNEVIRFKMITLPEAEAAYIEQQRLLAILISRLKELLFAEGIPV